MKFLPYENCFKQSKVLILIILFMYSVLQLTHCSNTTPLTWNYNLQFGKFTVASPSNTTVPVYSGLNYAITFNRLTNPVTNYNPALGFIDLSYMYGYYQLAYIGAYSNFLTSTSFIIEVYGIDSSARLTRFSINYLAVSKDFTDFFIWIDFELMVISQILNTTNSYTATQLLSSALPTTSNINTVISITQLNLAINEASPNLFEQQMTLNIIDTTHYNCTLSSLTPNTQVYNIRFYVIFYQKVTIPYQQTLLIPYLFSGSTASNSNQQIVFPSNLTDSFEVNVDNSFFGLSGISSILRADFTVIYQSNFSMSIAFNQTYVIAASVFIFRELPVCPLYYLQYKAESVCVCNNINCYQGVGCASVIAIGPNSNCLYCSILDNFGLNSNGSCVCKTGYQPNNETCEQICGDGIKFNDQCDDGNKVSGDGCSSQCTIQIGSQCYQNSSGTSVCLFKQNICFTLTTIQKNDDNSAIFTFQAFGNSLPLPFPTNAFEVKKTLTLTILRNDLTNCDINYTVNKIYGQTVQVLVDFQQTIEGYNAAVDFNFNSTNYLTQDCTLNFVCKGSQMPLIATRYTKQYLIMGKINLVLVCLLSALFIISMLAPKWIGIESIQVSQLIFFSQLLISDASNWPVAFQIFKYLKFTNGFNNIFTSQTVQTFSNNSKKWNFLDFQPAFILNFSVNFILILFFLTLFFLFKPKQKEGQNLRQQQSIQKKQTKTNNSQQTVSNQSKIQRKLYQFFINVAVWSLLQFLASMISQFELLKNPFNKYDFIVPLQVNALLMLTNFFGIIFIGFSLFSSMTLSLQTLRILKHKPQLLTYKKVNFAYHFIVGASMFCFNSFVFKRIPVSVLFFIAEILYIVFICKLQPYKQCVWIHSIGFIFNRFGYLIFLGFITIKNLLVNINEVVMLGMCYFVVVFIFIMILLAIIRLYYDIRLGEDYEKKMEEIRKAAQFEQKQRKKQKEQYELQEIEQEAKKKHSKSDSREVKYQNKYRIERIVLQEKQFELLQFIQKKKWSRVQKDKYYYQKYSEKPLAWLQKHDKKQYQIRMRENYQKSKRKDKKYMNEEDQKYLKELERFKRERRQELKGLRQKKQQKKTKKEKKKN